MAPPTPRGYRRLMVNDLPLNQRQCWDEHMEYFTIQIGHAMAHYKTRNWEDMEHICNKLLVYDNNLVQYPRLPTFYAAACKILMAVRMDDKRALNEAADAYEENWVGLMTAPDLAWNENSPFDEIPPQLDFVGRWHAEFLELGEKMLFEVGNRDSEQMNTIKQAFWELHGDGRREACEIIRRGVMGMEMIPDERLDREVYVRGYPDEVLDAVCNIIKDNRLSKFADWVENKEGSLGCGQGYRRKVRLLNMELYRVIMDTAMENWKHGDYSAMEKYARHLLQNYPELPRYYRAACLLLQGKRFGQEWQHISQALDGYLEHWSQPMFDPKNFLPRGSNPESYLDFIWRWHRCFIAMGEDLLDEETYIQDTRDLIEQKIKKLDEPTRQKVATIIRAGDARLKDIRTDELILDLNTYDLEHDVLDKVYQAVKTFQLAIFADVIERKYDEESEEESEAKFTGSSDDGDEEMSDYERSSIGIDAVEAEEGNEIDADEENDAASASEAMSVDDGPVWKPTNQQKWYITNEVNQLDGAHLRTVFGFLRDRVPSVQDWSVPELEIQVEDIPDDVLADVYIFLRQLTDAD